MAKKDLEIKKIAVAFAKWYAKRKGFDDSKYKVRGTFTYYADDRPDKYEPGNKTVSKLFDDFLKETEKNKC